MLTRRELVRSAMAFGAWPMLRSSAPDALPTTSPAAADDEAFWTRVRSQFEWEPESSNLVTVVRGLLWCEGSARNTFASLPLPEQPSSTHWK
jgi:hypothetical protein